MNALRSRKDLPELAKAPALEYLTVPDIQIVKKSLQRLMGKQAPRFPRLRQDELIALRAQACNLTYAAHRLRELANGKRTWAQMLDEINLLDHAGEVMNEILAGVPLPE